MSKWHQSQAHVIEIHSVSAVLMCQIFLNIFGQSGKISSCWYRMETSTVIHIFPHDLKETFSINLLLTPKLKE